MISHKQRDEERDRACRHVPERTLRVVGCRIVPAVRCNLCRAWLPDDVVLAQAVSA